MFAKKNLKPLKKISQTDIKKEKPYWHYAFVKRGYKDSSIPSSPPPDLNNYGEILTWITNDNFETDEDVSFAIDIWLKRSSLTELEPDI